MWTKSVTLNAGYNLDEGFPPELFPNERGASDLVFLAPPGKPSAGGYPAPAFAVTAEGSSRISRDVSRMPLWWTIVSTVALVIATGGRWSMRLLRGLTAGDRVFRSLHLASTAVPSPAESTRSSGSESRSAGLAA